MNIRNKTCARVQELLEAYYEDALAPRESAMVSSHLQECPSCAYELAQIGQIAQALEAVPHAEPRTDLARQISATISALPAPVSSRRLVAGWRRVEVLAAGSVALLGIWRYALPLLLSNEAAKVPIIGWFHTGAQFVMIRLSALSVVGENLWAALQGVSGALGLAATKGAPVLGLYAMAEIAFIVAVVLLGPRAHRLRSASLSMLM
jgi:anti-sigma factor RsiW